MRILVTGGSGFVGGHLLAQLQAQGHELHVATRREVLLPGGVTAVRVGDIGPDTDWSGALDGIDAVVHLAARVHVMRDSAADPLALYRHTNVEGTLRLARQAASAGVRRLVYLSSIKVNGEATTPGRPFTSTDAPAPVDPYGISKYEAEQGLLTIAAETDLEVAIIRPPLIYGPGVRANFLRLMRLLQRQLPLPFGRIRNRRSLLAVGSLVDLVACCLTHPGARNRIFLAADGESLSTPELLRRLAAALGVRARLVPVPHALVDGGLRLLGRGALAQRLCGSLEVDIRDTCQRLDWSPPVSVDAGLKAAADHYLREGAR